MAHPGSYRIGSIDVFRALTMFLMIFVNDLWSLIKIPDWLGHTAADHDGMGLADTVFPAFLFIVGLSIPFAIRNRVRKGQSTGYMLRHIFVRSFALIVMGVYMVNLESYNSELAVLHKYWWEILMAVAIFLVWNKYPEKKPSWPYLFYGFQATGVALLVFLAIIYRGGTIDQPEWMKTHWWGILGLIGWAYLISAVIYLFSKSRIWLLVGAMVFFNIFNVAHFAGWLESFTSIKRYIWIVGNGSMPAFTMAGVVASAFYMKYETLRSTWAYALLLMVFAAIMLGFGFGTRPAWGISKIWATPAWVGICTGIGLMGYAILSIVVDHYRKGKWFDIIKPAGTSTLTCYLIPYFIYPIVALLSLQLPLVLRTGGIGILKSVLFALLVISITGILEKLGIKLKV